MFRIDDPSAVGSLPTPAAAGTEGFFTEGNPGTGVPATRVTGDFLNLLQEELRNVVVAAGLTPSKTNNAQLLSAIRTLALGSGYMLVRDEKTAGTAGGASIAGNQTRNLNTVSANTITGASLASNQVTLPAGTYRVRASAPAGVGAHRAYLFNVTDGVNQVIGTTENGLTGVPTDPPYSRSWVEGRFTIAAAKVFELRHFTGEARATDGLGVGCSDTRVEVYSSAEFIKE